MSLDPSRLLVTGITGFIGRHFSARYGGVALRDERGRVSLEDASSVRAAISALRPEAVVHLAGQSSVGTSLRDPRKTYEINFLGTLNLLEALAAIKFTGVFLMASSADVYGSVSASNLPISETTALRPRSPYGVSKVAAEALCFEWSQAHAFRCVMVRPFNQIGPGHDIRFAIPNFARQIVEIRRGFRTPELHTGDLSVTRDFTDVRDSVRALRLLLDKGETGECYNLCSGKERTLRSVVDDLLKASGVEASIKTDPDRMRPAEQSRVVGDNTKIRSCTDWTPEIPFHTTMHDILNDVETQLNA